MGGRARCIQQSDHVGLTPAVHNPISVKLGPTVAPEDTVALAGH
nr:3-deoxy-7-phosphoheptulonate synthase [Streptomyces capitiformicae]